MDEIAVSAVTFMLFKRTVDQLNLPEREIGKCCSIRP